MVGNIFTPEEMAAHWAEGARVYKEIRDKELAALDEAVKRSGSPNAALILDFVKFCDIHASDMQSDRTSYTVRDMLYEYFDIPEDADLTDVEKMAHCIASSLRY